MSKSLYGTPRSYRDDEFLIPLGSMSGTCEEIMLTGLLDRIRVTANVSGGLQGVRFYRGNRAKTYGTITEDFSEWFFPDS